MSGHNRTWESHEWTGKNQWQHKLNQKQLDAFVYQMKSSTRALREMSRRVERLEQEIGKVQSMSHLCAQKTAESVGKLKDIRTSFHGNLSKFVFGLEEWNRESPEKIRSVLSLIEECDVRRRLDDVGRVLMTVLIPVIILIGEIAVFNAYLAILVSPQIHKDSTLRSFIDIVPIAITILLLVMFVFLGLGWSRWSRNVFRPHDDTQSKPSEPVDSQADFDTGESADQWRGHFRESKRSLSECDQVTDDIGLEELRGVWARSQSAHRRTEFVVPWAGRFARRELFDSGDSRVVRSKPVSSALKSYETIDVPNNQDKRSSSPLQRCHSFTPLTSGCKSLLDDDDDADKTLRRDAAMADPPAKRVSKMMRYVPNFWNTTPHLPQTNLSVAASSSISSRPRRSVINHSAFGKPPIRCRAKDEQAGTSHDSEKLNAQRILAFDDALCSDLGRAGRDTTLSQPSSFNLDCGAPEAGPVAICVDSPSASPKFRTHRL